MISKISKIKNVKFCRSSQSVNFSTKRSFIYFDDLEVKDGVAIDRLNGPG